MDSLELYEILRLRCDVFILEQRCIYPEHDNMDIKSLHLQYLLNGKLVGYLRLIPDSNNTFSVGRVVVKSDYRKMGIGKKMLEEALRLAKSMGGTNLKLNAQVRYRNTYVQTGYKICGAPFDEEGILHIPMNQSIENS